MQSHSSRIGFSISLFLHLVLIGWFCWSVFKNESANGHQATLIDTSISIEMLQGMMIEENKPAPQPVEPELNEPKEEVADPTLKPEPIKPQEPEKPKEKQPEKPQTKPKPKPKEKLKQPRPKGDQNIDSNSAITQKATTVGQVTTNNVDLLGTGSNKDEVILYMSALRREIERHKRYPNRAKMMRKQGIVKVSLQLNKDGSISNASVVNSSGVEDLDNAALQAVQNARSVGPKPSGVSSTITVPINFNLR